MADVKFIQRANEAVQTNAVGAPMRSHARNHRSTLPRKPGFAVHLCFPDDQIKYLPEGQVIPKWPAGVPAPRMGEVIYVTSTSAWAVSLVIHEIINGGGMRVEVWLEWVGPVHHRRDAECNFTQ